MPERINCWEVKKCAVEIRRTCPAFIENQGTKCWKITGTKCDSGKVEKATVGEKIKHCRQCSFYQQHADKY